MLGRHLRLLLGLLSVGCVTFGYPSLRCFTTLCPHNEPVCIELCEDPTTTGCVMIQNRNFEGELEPSYFHCTSSPTTCNSTTCELDQLTSLTPDVEYCCCTGDLCNSWPGFTDHLVDSLSSSEPTPAEPIPPGSNVCEEYYCVTGTDCYHGYRQCGDGDNCFAVYSVEDGGKLELVAKNCLNTPFLDDSDCSANSYCHIDNDLMPSERTLSCCCNGLACNQNITFTHPTQTINYGLNECEGLGCNHSCSIINNQPSCYCQDGYALGIDNVSCVDINECLFPDHGCAELCTNTPGSYKCECKPGNYLDVNGVCRSEDGIVCQNYSCNTDDDVCEVSVTHCQDSVPDDLRDDHNQHYCTAVYNYNGTGFSVAFLSCIAGAFPTCQDSLCRLDSVSEDTYSCCCHGNLCNSPDSIVFPSFLPVVPDSSGTVLSPSTSPAQSTVAPGTLPAHSSSTGLLDSSTGPQPDGVAKIELIVFSTITGVSIPLVVLIILVIVCIKIWMDKAIVIEPPPPPESIPESPVSMIKPDFVRVLGHGRFAKVYLAKLGGRHIAVKAFSSEAPARDSWNKERDIYSTPRLKHPNILQYLSLEPQTKCSGLGSYWLFFDYHPYGSLYDYLQCHTLSLQQFANLAESAAEGLAHLHSIFSEGGRIIKPAVAHRDLKSKNILVKNDLTCAISDFGLAIKFSPGESPVEAQGQVGTCRYMAPEVLEGAISFNQESFLRIDVYAFGLILWEMASMCDLGNGLRNEEYHPPFDTLVSPNPTIDEMKRVVAEERKRPVIPHGFTINSDLDLIVDIIQESWDPDAEARLSAKTIHMRFSHFQSSMVRPFNQASKESGLFSLPTSTSQRSLGSLDYQYPITPGPSTPSYISSTTMSPMDVKPPQISCQEGSTSCSSESSAKNSFDKPNSVEPAPSEIVFRSISLNRFDYQGGGHKLIHKNNQAVNSVPRPNMTRISNGISRHQSLCVPTKPRPSSVEASI